MSKKARIKRPVIPVPQNLDEAAEFLLQIGKKRRVIDMIQLNFNAKVDELKTRAIKEIESHQSEMMRSFEGLFAYAEARRDELTESGKRKTVKLPTGSFGWRFTPPAVSLRNVVSILKELKARKLNRFIRIKEEVNKEAMLAESKLAETVKGVSIVQIEEFVVKPADLDVEIASDAKKLKKAVT